MGDTLGLTPRVPLRPHLERADMADRKMWSGAGGHQTIFVMAGDCRFAMTWAAYRAQSPPPFADQPTAGQWDEDDLVALPALPEDPVPVLFTATRRTTRSA